MAKQTIYHATAVSDWQKIQANGLKIPAIDWAHFYTDGNRKKPGSLGYGLYEFWNDPELTKQFISKKPNLKEYAIIRLTLEVEEKHVLNLYDRLRDITFFRNFILNPDLS